MEEADKKLHAKKVPAPVDKKESSWLGNGLGLTSASVATLTQKNSNTDGGDKPFLGSLVKKLGKGFNKT